MPSKRLFLQVNSPITQSKLMISITSSVSDLCDTDLVIKITIIMITIFFGCKADTGFHFDY